MLLVIVDQARVRRRREHAVVASRQLLLTHVTVDDRGDAAAGTDTREVLQPGQGVERVPPQELRGGLDRTAFPTMLVTPIRLELGLARKLKIEVGRATRRSCRTREDDAKHV